MDNCIDNKNEKLSDSEDNEEVDNYNEELYNLTIKKQSQSANN